MQVNFWTRPVDPADINVPRTIAESQTTVSRLMELLDSNAHGNVHGGIIMRLVDETAAVVAIRHARRPAVTARIDHLDFLEPAFIGDLVTIKASLVYVGRTSMDIAVEVSAETLRTGQIRQICSSQLVFVALDENGKPTQVPPLKPTNEEEQLKINRAKMRRERYRQIEEELKREYE